jgi:Uma2 family endonuclease
MTLTIKLPSHVDQTQRNLGLWAELAADPTLAKWQGRIETDRHGHIIMSPYAAAIHGARQARLAHLLSALMNAGRVYTECPISTADGVKLADVAWASPENVRDLGDLLCFPQSPEICVEVLSRSNTKSEMIEKRELYFDAGAAEVWLCNESAEMTAEMTFFVSNRQQPASRLCPAFPQKLDL